MAQEGRSGVLLLGRDHLYLYNGNVILTLEFPATIIHDIDVKDREGLYGLIITFIQENKLLPAQLYIVLAESICFSKDFTIGNSDQSIKTEADIKEFIDAVPFSSVVSKIYKTANTFRVVGSKQDLIDTIIDAFENKGFGVSALVPASIFPDFGITADLTEAAARSVLEKKDTMVAASMVGERLANEQQLATSQTAVPKNKLLPYLIIGFVVLLVVLVVVIVIRK
jgi:hypothetical protein